METNCIHIYSETLCDWRYFYVGSNKFVSQINTTVRTEQTSFLLDDCYTFILLCVNTMNRMLW